MLMAACSDQELTPAVTAPGDGICLYATKLHLITRSGDVVARFATGTNYLLYALPHQDNTADYDWSAAKLYARPGTEADDATIDYGEVTSFSVGQPLDFYAAAVDRETEKLAYTLPGAAYTTYADASDRVAPVVTWRDGYGKNSASEGLGDLMVCTKIGATYEDGAVSLPFTHALTRFTFTVAKEDESGKADNSKFLEQVTLRKITLEGTHNCATYSLVDKMWTAAENSAVTRVVYDNATHINDKNSDGVLPNDGSLTTTFVEVPDSLMLFPNTLRLADGAAPTTELLTLKVQLHFPTWPSGADMNDAITEMQADGSYLVTVSFPLTVGNLTGETVTDENGKETSELSTEPMSFVANSSYQLSILVTGDAIRILTIAPTVYEWITQEVDATEAVVGTPVTMGGLMWMDRNLGAATYDAATDFYNSIGYYYQYGRNIPYILDVGKFVRFTYDDDGDSEDDNDANTSSSFITNMSQGYGPHIVKKTKSTKETDPNNPYYFWYLRGKSAQLTSKLKSELIELQEQCMYTFDHKGDTVWGILYKAEDKAFFNPGEKVYNEDGSVNDEETSSRYRLAVITEEGKSASNWRKSIINDQWLPLDNQPCPKGWRLPTHKDLYAIMPWGGRVQWGYRPLLSVKNELTGESHTPSNLWWDYAMEHDGVEEGSYSYSSSATEGSAKWISTKEEPKKGWYRKSTASDQSTYGEFAGSVQEIRFGTKRKSDGSTYNVIYMLKWKGNDKAYRIRIMSHFAKAYGDSRYTTKDKTEDSKNKRYITISRYTAEKDKDIDYYVQNGNDETMWDNPIETLFYPCAGFLVTDANYWDLRSFGEGVVLRTSESKGNSDVSWVQYLATATYNVSIENSSRRSLGDQIRCCRDISANY
jgi:hypothetical protein